MSYDPQFERDLRQTIRAAMVGGSGLDSQALDELGWSDVYADSPQLAVSTLSEEAGAAARPVSGSDVETSTLLGEQGYPAVSVTRSPVAGWSHLSAGAVVDADLTITFGSETPILLVAVRPDGSAGSVMLSGGHGVALVAGAHAASHLHAATGPREVLAVLPDDLAIEVERRLMLARAHERIGLSARMIEVAVAHVSERHQFGGPLGALQAVQHRLAESKVALEAARSTLRSAWSSLDVPSAVVAATWAATSLETATRHTLQVSGGMGFTMEFALADLLARSVVLGTLEPSSAVFESRAGQVARANGVARLSALEDKQEEMA